MKPGDSRCTPEEVLEVVRNFGTIALDPCSNPHSTVGAVYSFDLSITEEQDRENRQAHGRGEPPVMRADGITQGWAPYVPVQGFAWVNPPWSKPLPWAEKCRDEWYRHRVESLLWLPCYPETETSQVMWDHCSRILFWHRRVHHPSPDSGEGGSMWPTWMGYFGERTDDFERVFRPYGRVIPAGRELRRICG